MASRKRPLTELQNSQTPTRYAPSTPHAIRAFQQRSGAKTRSVRKRRALSDTVRPDSARGILRQLAKITAPATKKIVPTPETVRGKENRTPVKGWQEDEEERPERRPRLTLDIDESLESIEAPEVVEDDEEDSELPVAPTPSVLPDQDEDRSEIENYNPTFTLRSIDYARNALSPDSTRRASRRSFPASDPIIHHDGDNESTFLSERGRRAPTLEPTENLSRYEFGDINMDDFHSAFEIRQEANRPGQSKSPEKRQDDLVEIDAVYASLEDAGGETEALKHLQDLQRSPFSPPPDESNVDIPTFDDSNFQLLEPDLGATSNQAQASTAAKLADASLLEYDLGQSEDDSEPEAEKEAQLDEEINVKQSTKPHPIGGESSKPLSQTRRKKLKLTRHGEMVPSLPSSLIKRVAIEAQARLGNRRPKLGKDHMKALEQATEWFFEQVSEDLEAYSNHARRKKRIDQSDVLLLMRRQRLLQGDGELLKAARELLPKDVVADLDLDESSEA